MIRTLVSAFVLAVGLGAQTGEPPVPPPAKAPESAPAEAPTPTPPQEATKKLLTIDFKPALFEYEIKEGILYAAGNVRFRVGDMIVRADNLIAWVDLERRNKKPAEPNPEQGAPIIGEKLQARMDALPIKEFYADGTVLFSQGQETVKAERVFFDLENDRGLIVDATMSMGIPYREGKGPLVVHADELRVLAKNRFVGSGVKLTTCNFAHPHFHVASDRVELIRERPGYLEAGPDAQPVENYHVAVEGNTLHVGHTPVFWLPDFVGDSAARKPFVNIEDVRFRSSNEFGREIGLTIGGDIEAGGNRWGHWRLHGDWLSKRGFGTGVDLVYGTPDYRGDFRSRYQRDRGRDRFFGRPPSKDRYRLSWRHRHKLPWDIQLDLEYQNFSDFGFYPTYFEDEDKGDKPPENLIYLKKAFFNSQVSALFKIRANDFLSQVEQKPELRYDIITEPLFDIAGRPLYLSSTLRFSNSRVRVSDQIGSSLPRSVRTDADSVIEYAFPVGPLKIRPFAGIRHTWWEKDLVNENDQQRFGFTHGATVSLQAWRVWDSQGGLFNLRGLRHVVIPQVTFRNTVGIDVRPTTLLPIDEIERFDNRQAVELRMRNLFQTIRQRRQGPEPENIIDLEISIDYFPNANRDNGGDPWSNLDVDLVVRFSDDLQLVSDFEANFYGRGFEVANIAVGYTPSPELQIYSGFRHFDDTYNVVFAQTNWRINEKWQVTAGTAYDFLDGRGLEHRITLSRIGHDWVFQFEFRADPGENDIFFGFSFEPRVLFQSILQPRGLRSEPRLAYIGSGLRN